MCSRVEALTEMKQNLAQYEHFSSEAESVSTDIIVFPEDGLTGFEFLDPEYFHPFLQHVPDNYFGWNPCLYPGSNNNLFRVEVMCNVEGNRSEVVTILSCLAANKRMFLVANIGRQVSRSGEDLMFNTDLAFDRC